MEIYAPRNRIIDCPPCMFVPVSSRFTVLLMGWKRATWDASHFMSDKWLLLTGIKRMVLLDLNSPVSDPFILPLDVLSEITVYIYNYSRLLATFLYFAKAVISGLWAVLAEQHAQHTWFLTHTSQEGNKCTFVYHYISTLLGSGAEWPKGGTSDKFQAC